MWRQKGYCRFSVNWGTVIDQSNLTYTECFATTPKASLNKHALSNHRRNDFEVLLITANSITYVCPVIGMYIIK